MNFSLLFANQLSHDPIAMVAAFRKKYGYFLADKPTFNRERAMVQYRLMQEELGEFLDAVEEKNIVGMADALADLSYVVIGSALSFGIPLASCFAEVHRSNMSKGLPTADNPHKPTKGEGFFPPDLGRLLSGEPTNWEELYEAYTSVQEENAQLTAENNRLKEELTNVR